MSGIQNELHIKTERFLSAEGRANILMKNLKEQQAEFKEAMKEKNEAYEDLVKYLHKEERKIDEPKIEEAKSKRKPKKKEENKNKIPM